MAAQPSTNPTMHSTFLYGANVHANGIRQHYFRYGGKGRQVVVVLGSPAVTWGFVAERFGLRKLQPVIEVAHVENAGHMIPWDDEEGFYRAFGNFLGDAL